MRFRQPKNAAEALAQQKTELKWLLNTGQITQQEYMARIDDLRRKEQLTDAEGDELSALETAETNSTPRVGKVVKTAFAAAAQTKAPTQRERREKEEAAAKSKKTKIIIAVAVLLIIVVGGAVWLKFFRKAG